MSDEQDVVVSSDVPEVQPPIHARAALWHAAFWAGVKYKDVVVEALQQGHRVWFTELAPLTIEERILVMGSLCKQLFEGMTEDAERDMYAVLVKMYGPLKKTSKKKGGAYAH
jgi:hypothetical protein